MVRRRRRELDPGTVEARLTAYDPAVWGGDPYAWLEARAVWEREHGAALADPPSWPAFPWDPETDPP